MITFVPKAGLGNRMRGIASAYRLAQSIDEKLEIVWINNHECNCSPRLLFELPEHVVVKDIPWIPVPLAVRMRIQDLIRSVFKKNRDLVLLDEDLWDMEQSFIKSLKGKNIYIETAAGWDCEEEDSFDIFNVNSELIHNVECFLKTNHLNDKELIGVHIRRTDMESATEESPRESFVNCMQKELQDNPDVCFYLATDDVSEKEFFRNAFGTNYIYCQDIVTDRQSPAGIQKALEEIVLLGKCKKIYGTKGSSFSNLAADMSHTPFVAVVKDM